MSLRIIPPCVKFAPLPLCASASAAAAHASEQGFVLLLPTGAYTAAGVFVVGLTALALVAAPDGLLRRLFHARRLRTGEMDAGKTAVSLVSFIAMAGLLYVGLNGSRDPLSNPLPLAFWTLGWVALVCLFGVCGDLWRWLNPWRGVYRLMGAPSPMARLPDRIGVWPAVAVLIGFAAFLLADIAPDDPARLTYFVAGYWAAMMAGMIAFGSRWLEAAELGTVLSSTFARLAPLRLGSGGGVGAPGWRLLEEPRAPAVGLFTLTLLAVGSFDGMNETFLWLGWIGVNPLEFPGRSAVVAPTLIGLFAAIVALVSVFAATVWLGRALVDARGGFQAAFGALALTVAPIALAYHFAHFLTAFIVNGQYALAAFSDPLATGADYLGIEPFQVTTGFFNRLDTVRVIWLAQAGAVVIGHVWSVLLAHRTAMDLTDGSRRAALMTAPLSLLMVAYTFLGLWLLATPRGA